MVQEACGGHMVIWYPPTCLIYEPLYTYAGAGFLFSSLGGALVSWRGYMFLARFFFSVMMLNHMIMSISPPVRAS